jgi:chitinase
MRIWTFCVLAAAARVLCGQGTVPVFQHVVGHGSYTMLGHAPEQGSATTIPTVMVPITLFFEAEKAVGRPAILDAAPDVAAVMGSPIFANFAFPSGGTTQYADAMLRSTFPKATGWHTLLGTPEVKAIGIHIPVGSGYLLTSKKTGRAMGVVDLEFLQKKLFEQLPKQDGALVIAVTHNTTYYTLGDATVCCSWGTHGVDSATQNSFVLGSYLSDAPAVVQDQDVQPLTQQLAEFVNDPLHDPLIQPDSKSKAPGNVFPAWMRPASMPSGDQGTCGGTGVASTYFLLEPTSTNPKNNIPVSRAFVAHSGETEWHLESAALLPWYTGAAEGLGGSYSFPDAKALSEPAKPCAPRRHRGEAAAPTATAVAAGAPNGHWLIGYWNGSFPLREVSPQWDVIIIAFATPDHSAPEGTLRFQPPRGMAAAQFKADIAWMKGHGRKVMISLGGGGENFTLADPARVDTFVSSVARIVSDYGFDGIDIDFETPSLDIDPGDNDFQHPVTPSIVNLISGLRQLRERFGPGFMISLVPEGTQVPAGYPSYGGQFGSYLPIIYALHDILSFVDVQDYNTPPLQGLDGEIYQGGTVDYHGAMTDLLLHGFDVGGDPARRFQPLPSDKVAVGFLTGDATATEVKQAMQFIIKGKAPAGTKYKLRKPGGYPGMIGAMFWTIDDDRRENYRFSNVVGPELHGK